MAADAIESIYLRQVPVTVLPSQAGRFECAELSGCGKFSQSVFKHSYLPGYCSSNFRPSKKRVDKLDKLSPHSKLKVHPILNNVRTSDSMHTYPHAYIHTAYSLSLNVRSTQEAQLDEHQQRKRRWLTTLPASLQSGQRVE